MVRYYNTNTSVKESTAWNPVELRSGILNVGQMKDAVECNGQWAGVADADRTATVYRGASNEEKRHSLKSWC